MAKKTGQLVELTRAREAVLKAIGLSASCVISMEVGAKKGGKLMAIHASIFYNS